MRIKSKTYLRISIIMIMVMLVVMVQNLITRAQESIEDQNISLFTLGEDGETILVRGLESTVGDYGDVMGYEITSYDGSGYTEYRDNLHHTMWVSSAQGITEGYCMQPYVNGPGTNAYVDYSYEEGLVNSSIFNSLSGYEQSRWLTSYVVATKYAFGGTMADPNCKEGRNIHDGGTYGTYIIDRDGKPTVVSGLMIGGKVYVMTPDEARSLTQVIVHYVGNRISDKTITDFRGYTNPEETSAAFKHLRLYADSGRTQYDTGKTISEACTIFDQENAANPVQRFEWYVYNETNKIWESYSGQKLDENYLDTDRKIKLRVDYFSKYMCNKLVTNGDSSYVKVQHSYEPYVVSSKDANAGYYDYFTVDNDGDYPMTVTYDMITAGKNDYTNGYLWGHTYQVDTFGQSATITLDAETLINQNNYLRLTVNTGQGTYAAKSYDSETGTYGTRMYSCPQVQDCLFLASNSVTSHNDSVELDVAVTGTISLNKVSLRVDITEDNPCYNMSGAEYKVYVVSSNKDTSKSKHIGTFVTNSNGVGSVTWNNYNSDDVGAEKLSDLPLGWYMVCEEKAPTNGSYEIDSEMYYVNINYDNHMTTHVVRSKEEPMADPIPFEIVKVSAEGENLGGGTLEGAEFTVYYYKGQYDSYQQIKEKQIAADRKWILSTRVINSTNNATCIIHQDLLQEGSDELFLDKKGNAILPLGTIVVMETKAPVGYTLEDVRYNVVDTMSGAVTPLDEPYTSVVHVNEGTIKLQAGNKILVQETAVRGDLCLVKLDKHTGKPMAGIPFSITSKTTGESHVIVTDENGVASTASKHILHSKNTNENDNVSEASDNLKPSGVWFNGYVTDTVSTNTDAVQLYKSLDDERGALPYDTYIIKELSCQANKDYVLTKEWQVVINKNNSTYDCGKKENAHVPDISTDVFDLEDNDKKVWLDKKISIVDYVEYNYLEPDRKYTLKGIIMNKATGEPIEVDGKEISTTVEFTPEKHYGTTQVPFEFKLGCCKGDKLVVFEYLYDAETNELVASHADINCGKQTITLESEGTTEVTTETTTETTTEATTEKTTETTTEESEVKGVQSPATGDSFNIVCVLVCMGLALIGVVLMVKCKKSC